MHTPPATALHGEMTRLARSLGRARGELRLRRFWRVLLLALLGLAVVSKAGSPVPGLRQLHGAWVAVALFAAGLLVLPRLLRPWLARWSQPATTTLARSLDDAHGWRDDTSTAWGLEQRAVPAAAALAEFLVTQSAGRLRELPQVPAPAFRQRIWDWLLVALIAFVLLAPGVGGLRAGEGAHGPTDREGQNTPLYPGVGAPAPLPADLWLGVFVEDPPEVQALESEPKSGREPDVVKAQER